MRRKIYEIEKRVEADKTATGSNLAMIEKGLQTLGVDQQQTTTPDVPDNKPRLKPPERSANAGRPGVVLKESALSAIVVDEPQPPKSIAAIHVVKAGTKLGPLYSYKYDLMKQKFGEPTAVDPGEYDLVCKTAGGGTFVLAKGISVKQQTAFVNPNAIVGTILVEPLTLEAFPKIKELTVVASDGDRFVCQQTQTLGTALPIIPGKYDLVCTTADGAKFTLAKAVEVNPTAATRIVADREVAAIVVRDPKLEGLTVKRILLLEAGTNLIKQETKRFDVPIMVDADTSYDVLLEQASGSTTYQKGVKPKRGTITYVPE